MSGAVSSHALQRMSSSLPSPSQRSCHSGLVCDGLQCCVSCEEEVRSVQVDSLVWACAKYSAPPAPSAPAPYIHCSPSSSRSSHREVAWPRYGSENGRWLLKAVSLFRAESSAVYFHIYFHVLTQIIQLKSRLNIYKMIVTSVVDVWPVWRGCWRFTLTAPWRWSMISPIVRGWSYPNFYV